VYRWLHDRRDPAAADTQALIGDVERAPPV
jgi:hypothetical protein